MGKWCSMVLKITKCINSDTFYSEKLRNVLLEKDHPCNTVMHFYNDIDFMAGF